jgi:hypothetical protein
MLHNIFCFVQINNSKLMSRLSYTGCTVPGFPARLSPGCLVLALMGWLYVLTILSCLLSLTVLSLAVSSWLHCSFSHIPDVLSKSYIWLSLSGCPFLAVLFGMSCPDCLFPCCPVLTVLSCLYSPGSPVQL